MKAIIQTGYGAPDVLSISELPKPTIKEDEVLIKVSHANVSSGDARVRSLDMPTLVKPLVRLIYGWRGLKHKVPGVGGSGIIETVGASVTKFKVGDHVHFISGFKMGACADYVAYKATSCIAKTPDNISLKDAAPLAFGLLTAHYFININTVKPGNHVLIYGASGSVGTYAVQLAKYYGATVTAISSKKNHKLLTSLGADRTIDYHTTDFKKQETIYDVIFDAVGKINKKDCKTILKNNGVYATVKSMTSEKQVLLEALNDILKSGNIQTVIEKVYPFAQIREAHQHVDSHHKVGNIVLEVNP